MIAAGIPVKFPVPWASSAGGAYIRAIPLAPTAQDGAASLELGFPPDTFTAVGAGGIPPFGQDANGILNQETSWSQWLQAGGPIPFDAVFAGQISGYPKGATIPAANAPGYWWTSTADSNGADPEAGGANWLSSGQLSNYFDDAGGVNAIVVTSPVKIAGLVKGQGYRIRVAANNTGATTIAIALPGGGSLGPFALKTQIGLDVMANDLVGGAVIDVAAISTSVFQWIAAQPDSTYISARTQRAPVTGNMLIPIWNPNTGRNECISAADLASYLGQQGLLLPYYLGMMGGP